MTILSTPKPAQSRSSTTLHLKALLALTYERAIPAALEFTCDSNNHKLSAGAETRRKKFKAHLPFYRIRWQSRLVIAPSSSPFGDKLDSNPEAVERSTRNINCTAEVITKQLHLKTPVISHLSRF